MSQPEQPKTPATPSQAGSKLLARYADTDALFQRAIPMVDSGPVPGSIPLQRFQELEQEIRFAPANSGPYVELGQIYIQHQRWVDARRVLDSGVQFCPDCEALTLMHEDLSLLQSNLLVDAAKLNAAQNPGEQAKYELEQAEISHANERIRVCKVRYGRHPDKRDILITWAIALRQLSRHEEAVELLDRASLDPMIRARACLQLGMCYQFLSRPLEALAAFRRAALFRVPPPEPKLRQRALELAVEVAEQHGLIDSARYYAKLLVDSAEPNSKRLFEAKLIQLQAMEL